MKKIIQTAMAPAPIGAYSQAIRCGNTVYLSGQVPLIPDTMVLCRGDFIEQLDQVFMNLLAVCQAAGGTLADIVKINVYLTDIQNSVYLNDVMTRHFTVPYPARTTVAVRALPRGADVEVEAIMVLADS